MNRALLIRFAFMALFIIPTSLSAQVPLIPWYKCLGGTRGETAKSVKSTSDGGFIVAGWTDSHDGDVTGAKSANDFWIVKCSSNGSMEWQQALGSLYIDIAESILQTPDGGYLVAGMCTGAGGDVTGSYGNFDFWLIKLSSTGVLEWKKCYGGLQVDMANAVDFTTDGGFIIGGYTESSDGNVTGHIGSEDFWVVKINTAGNILWQKCFGGSGSDQINSVKSSSDGGYILAGTTTSPEKQRFSYGYDGWIIKLDEWGNVQWEKVIGGTYHDIPWSIKQTPDGGFVVAGETRSSDGDISVNKGGIDYWIVRLTSTGEINWEKTYGGSADESAQEIEVTQDGDFVVAGFTYSSDGDVSCNNGNADAWVLKLGSAGNLLWQKTFGLEQDDLAYTIAEVSKGKYLIGGNTASTNLSGFHSPIDATPGIDMLLFEVKELDTDSLHASVDGPTKICHGENAGFTVTSNVQAPGISYLWTLNGQVVGNNSSTFSSRNIVQNSQLVCRIIIPATCTNAEIGFSDTLHVEVNSSKSAPLVTVTAAETSVCEGTSINLVADAGDDDFGWRFQWYVDDTEVGTNARTYQLTTPQDGNKVYCNIFADNNACGSAFGQSNIVDIRVHKMPEVNITPADTSILVGSSLLLQANASGPVTSFRWQPADKIISVNTASSATVPLTADTDFSIAIVGEGGCKAIARTSVKIIRSLKMKMPNVFSPNSDGINDIFKIPAHVKLHLNEFAVFDRWGNKVYSTANIHSGWDGTIKGKKAGTGSYVYTIRGEEENKPILFKGSFLLIR